MNELGGQFHGGSQAIDHLHAMKAHFHVHEHTEVPENIGEKTESRRQDQQRKKEVTYSVIWLELISFNRDSMATKGFCSTRSAKLRGASPL
jgi:hypothetical protein